MHILLPYAGWLPGAADDLPLPALHTLLSKMQLLRQDARPENAFYYFKHEANIGAMQGLGGAENGRLALAALQRQLSGLAPAAGEVWGRISLCNWQIGMNDGQLRAPAQLAIEATEAEQLWQALTPLLAECGLHIAAYPVLPPYARQVRVDGILANLPCASVERVAGCELSDYLPRSQSTQAGQSHSPAAAWQSSLAQAQMLLYNHPVNNAREARRQPALNSLWLDGVGALPTGFAPAAIEIIPDLQQAAERGDVAAWRQAWLRIERECVPTWQAALDTGRALEITLCGLHSSAHFGAQTPSWGRRCWQALRSLLRPQPALHWPAQLSESA